MENKKGPIGRYAIMQAGFWIEFLILTNFAALFLAERGFTTRQIGLVTALGSLFSIVIQQVVGVISDKSNKPLKGTAAGFLILCSVSILALKFLPHTYISTFVFFTTALTLEISMQPILSSISLQFTHHGYYMNYGLSRACGSLGYAIFALFMGNLTSYYGPEVILIVSLAIYLLILCMDLLLPIPKGKESNIEIRKEKPSGLIEFFSKYKRFTVLIFGFVCLWFMNNVLGTYMLYFVEYYGGSVKQMSLPFSIMAFSEVPAVMFGNHIMKKMGAGKMLRISALGGLFKNILYLLAPNIFFFTWSNLGHFFLSGFYQVAAIYYCFEIVEKKDMVKGQAILSVFVAGIATMVANYTGGILLDIVTIPVIYIIAIIVSTVALMLIWIATSDKFFKDEKVKEELSRG